MAYVSCSWEDGGVSEIEDLAVAVWQEEFGPLPEERLDSAGGPLDPDAWCMEAAAAIAKNEPVPHLYKNAPGFSSDLRERVLARRS